MHGPDYIPWRRATSQSWQYPADATLRQPEQPKTDWTKITAYRKDQQS